MGHLYHVRSFDATVCHSYLFVYLESDNERLSWQTKNWSMFLLCRHIHLKGYTTTHILLVLPARLFVCAFHVNALPAVASLVRQATLRHLQVAHPHVFFVLGRYGRHEKEGRGSASC